MKQVYLDYAASTPVDPRVEEAMRPYFGEFFGNPSSLHHFGQKTSRAVFGARRSIAGALEADPEDIIFTGSATEANNLAIRGIWRGIRDTRKWKNPRIVTLAIEHESVLNICKDLASEGVEVIIIPVDKNGFIDLKKFKASLTPETFLISVMHANNEVGTIQPISEIATIVRNFRESRIKNQESDKKSDSQPMIRDSLFMLPLLHTDAVQSFQYLDCRPAQLGVDLMTLSAHKIYGPKGVGALYANQAARKMIYPIIIGSGQENSLRSGTENVPGIVGFARAVELAVQVRAKEAARISGLRDYFWGKLQAGLPTGQAGLGRKAAVNGSPKSRLPNNLNIYFPGHQAHDLLIGFDLLGVGVSPGAACSARVSKTSYVLEEMGFPSERASGSLRFSFGRQTRKPDIDYVISVIIKVLK